MFTETQLRKIVFTCSYRKRTKNTLLEVIELFAHVVSRTKYKIEALLKKYILYRL